MPFGVVISVTICCAPLAITVLSFSELHVLSTCLLRCECFRPKNVIFYYDSVDRFTHTSEFKNKHSLSVL